MAGRRKTNLHLPPRMYEKCGTYYYVTHDNKWIKLSRDLDEAKLKWAQMECATPDSGSMAALIERYMAETVPTKAARTQRDNQKEVVNLLKVFGKMRPKDVRPTHVARYITIRGKEAPVRANREKALLSHIFTCAKEWGWEGVDSNPCSRVKGNEELPRDRYVDDEEFLAVHKHANLIVQLAMELSYYTSLSKGDMLKLRRAQIVDEGIYLGKRGKIQKKKGAKKLLYEWTPQLRDVVDRILALPRPDGTVFLLATREGEQYTSNGFDAMWKRAMAKAVKLDGIESFTFHDIRAKSLTDADEEGLNAQMLAGHLSAKTTERYLRSKKVFKVPTLGRDLRQKGQQEARHEKGS